jgi:hypothetical protein
MAFKREAAETHADRMADELIAQLREIPDVAEIYSEYWRGLVIVTAFVETDAAEIAAIELEIAMARRDPDFGVDLRVYKPTPEVRAEYRAQVPETLEWARDEQGV